MPIAVGVKVRRMVFMLIICFDKKLIKTIAYVKCFSDCLFRYGIFTFAWKILTCVKALGCAGVPSSMDG